MKITAAESNPGRGLLKQREHLLSPPAFWLWGGGGEEEQDEGVGGGGSRGRQEKREVKSVREGGWVYV